ncbi:MAG: RNA polymerase factor sigma-54 [Bacteroidetes bacterium]|nr:RNA polymerase factor sigma-54 [Bacteroidota bacterium]
MIKQSLSLKQLQKLSPQQIQLMKLLQVPTANLEQRIKEEMESNPALEELGEGDEISVEVNTSDIEPKSADHESSEGPMEDSSELDLDSGPEEDLSGNDDIDVSEYIDDDEVADYKTHDIHEYNGDDEEKSKTIPIPLEITFHEHVISQLGMLDLDDREYSIAEHLVGSLDDDGYLRRELDAVVDDLSFTRNIQSTEAELQQLLKMIQSFEPAGIGARDLKECLLIQLLRKEKTSSVKLAIRIIEKGFEAFTKKHYDKLIKEFEVEEEDLKKAIAEIIHLNPRPGGAVDSTNKFFTYIIPDYTITNSNDELTLSLNSLNAPELRVSKDFKDMMKSYKDSKDKSQKEAVYFIKQKLESAKWFIDAIKQRQQTMIITMQSIMKLQHQFFKTGDESTLRPMILKDVAEMTNLDISTISRVANSKYVQTEFGTFLLKFFFSEAMTNDSGEEISSREIKKILTELVENESKKKPLSDEQLTKELIKRGYNIARRTVAKYREQMNFSVARMRKQI